jgi:hypothetical protein
MLSSVLLSEIEANPPGTADNRFEYVELAGTPGLSLTNDYFVTFDGSAGTTGVADLVVSLSGYSLGSTGLLEIQSSATAGHAVPAGTTLVSDPTFFTQAGGFANGTLSFYLFNSPSPFAAGTDYDINDDGTLDHLPAGATVLDNVAIPDTNNKGDLVYGGVVVAENPNQNKGTADAVTRFPGNTSTTSAAWYGGELVDTGNVDAQLNYDPTRESVNEPANAYLTPGAFNFQRSTPMVTINSGNAVYSGSAYVPSATVTGSTGTDSGAALSYSYYAGSNISGTALASAPVIAGTYTVIASFEGDSAYLGSNSAAVSFNITPSTVLPAWLSAGSSGQATWGGKVLNVTGAVKIVSNPGSDEPEIVANGTAAKVSITPVSSAVEIDLGGIALSNGASMVMTTDRSVLVVGTGLPNGSAILSIDSQSSLDLGDNGAIFRDGSLPAIAMAVRAGSTSAEGVVSSVADASAAHITGLACIANSTGGAALYNSFDGVAVSSGDVLVEYTYIGDANLDGKVDGSDYSLIDNGYLNHLTGWFNGDFNYDGVVDGSDYTLIDNAFNQQGASLAAQIAVPVVRVNRSTATMMPVFSSTAISGQSSADSATSELFGEGDELSDPRRRDGRLLTGEAERV